ncbi:MAG: hypothetical protein P4L33_12430 [Capsulimonadaceae bacterium]|nr:hypothetical protein [Capsulimonadaceae bacterium]
MRKTVKLLLLWAGVSLWFPSIALFLITDLWGCQLFLLLAAGLTLLWIVNMVRNGPTVKLPKDMVWFYSAVLLEGAICTVASQDFSRSLQTYIANGLRLLLSAAICYWICRDSEYLSSFIIGFRRAGIVSAVYAIFQAIALPYDFPGSYIPLNNPSFLNSTQAGAVSSSRALGATPEPSVLASLLIALVGIETVNVVVFGGKKQYLTWIIVVAGYIETGSQSIALLPLVLILALALPLLLLKAPRRLDRTDMRALVVGGLAVALVLIASPSIIWSFSRMGGSNGPNVSAMTRLADILVGLFMFLDHPLTGVGLGVSPQMILSYVSATHIPSFDSGITAGMFRMLAEEGLLAVAILLVGAILAMPRFRMRDFNSHDAAVQGYLASYIVGIGLSSALFVGYTELYPAWLLFPVALAMKYSARQRISVSSSTAAER